MELLGHQMSEQSSIVFIFTLIVRIKRRHSVIYGFTLTSKRVAGNKTEIVRILIVATT